MEKGGFILEEEQLSVQAGVPRREQCLVCEKPIFLAERMRVGDKFYHRRCLKCARCETQLTLGSFYETEVDGQFCCETCPDEEVNNRQSSNSEDEEEDDQVTVKERQKRLAAAAEEDKRISSLISNRLAMFERKPEDRDRGDAVRPSWRNSSLSDEQKSKSMMKNFLGGAEAEEESEQPPPLPSEGPPEKKKEIVPETTEVILRDEESKPAAVRESQSVSNIREMFEKRGQGRTWEEKDKKVEIEVDECPKEEEGKHVPRPESISDFYSPIAPPRAGETGQRNAMALKVIPIEFKTPRKPSVEDWKDVQEKEEDETLTEEETGGGGDDDVFLTPKARTAAATTRDESTGDEKKKDEEEEMELNVEVKEQTKGEEESEKVIAVPDGPLQLESGGAVEGELNELKKESEESSATKERDRVKEEPSLELIRSSTDADEAKIATDGGGDDQTEETQNNCNEIAAQAEEKEEVVAVPSKKEEVEVQVEVKAGDEKYPLDLNPFGSDAEEEDGEMDKSGTSGRSYNRSLNPFGEDDEGEDEQEEKIKVVYRQTEKKRVSTNPFGSEEDDDEVGAKKVTPLPMPRRTIMSQRPEPSPRFQLRVPTRDSYYGSVSSLSKSSDFRGSTNSLSSSCSSANTSGTYQRTLKKRRAPLPPSMREANSAEHLTALSPPRKSSDASMVSDKSGQKSTSNSPRVTRKKRPAPKPPGPVESPPANKTTPVKVGLANTSIATLQSPPFDSANSEKEPLHSTPLKVGDKALCFSTDGGDKMSEILENSGETSSAHVPETSVRRVIPVDDQMLEDQMEEISMTQSMVDHSIVDDSVFYRRVIVPLADDESPLKEGRSSSRQWEKMKQNKESENRNRQSLVSNSSDGASELDRFYNKSQQGKWKRRKGPAPALPVPPKRVLQMLPIQDIRHELEVIEVQQQGLEKQGVQLEKMIRERTEGPESQERLSQLDLDNSTLSATNRNTKEVEDLIMQLFDLVVEKNELFRRQAELMYLRRQHRLEAEQADLEYEIRVLMAQPECNKTDSDKTKEETMIARLMEVVKQRNAVVDCLEMDRLREAQEDLGIKQEIEKHTAKWDEEFSVQNQKPVKLSKKEKKTLKEEKKKLKNKKLDVDKDYDETEVDKSLSASGTLEKVKKKKKKFLIL